MNILKTMEEYLIACEKYDDHNSYDDISKVLQRNVNNLLQSLFPHFEYTDTALFSIDNEPIVIYDYYIDLIEIKNKKRSKYNPFRLKTYLATIGSGKVFKFKTYSKVPKFKNKLVSMFIIEKINDEYDNYHFSLLSRKTMKYEFHTLKVKRDIS